MEVQIKLSTATYTNGESYLGTYVIFMSWLKSKWSVWPPPKNDSFKDHIEYGNNKCTYLLPCPIYVNVTWVNT